MAAAIGKTPIHDWHVKNGGRMVDFAGWSMPIQYSTITEEHVATRNSVTIFDVSHMGRIRFDGPGAAGFLDSVLSRRVDNLALGRIRYSLATNENGGVLDDLLVYHIHGVLGEDYYGLVVNASNREKLVDWFHSRLKSHNVQMVDETLGSAMFAVQGPAAVRVVEKTLDDDTLSKMKYYTTQTSRLGEMPILVSRTGYTGEDGYELTISSDCANTLWKAIMDAGQDEGITAAGLGARDTLRLEAGMPLYGHELSEEWTPIEACLDFAISEKGRDFPGLKAIQSAKSDPNRPRLVGLRLEGKRVPRQDYSLLSTDETQIGRVSSGTFSPTLNYPIAMGFVAQNMTDIGTKLLVDIRGRNAEAEVVPLPFYKRS